LEDLPPVVQTIATAREDARLEFEDEMGYGSQETDNVAPMLVDLFALAQLLAQESYVAPQGIGIQIFVERTKSWLSATFVFTFTL
jgi:hypothetical protein